MLVTDNLGEAEKGRVDYIEQQNIQDGREYRYLGHDISSNETNEALQQTETRSKMKNLLARVLKLYVLPF